MTLVDRPLIQYAIEEAREAGIEEFIFVTSGENTVLERHVSPAPTLERTLRERGKTAILAEVERIGALGRQVRFAGQEAPLGLGHAVACARHLIGDEPFAVILPDDVVAAGRPCIGQMIEAHAVTGGSMIAVESVARERVSSYGILDVADDMGRIVAARGLVEKPTPEAAPSTLAVIGRYVLDAAVMRALAITTPGAGGEIQLTDAITSTLGTGAVYGYRFEGERFDCGSVEGFVEATLAFAMARPDLASATRDTMARRLAATQHAARRIA
jgi:UTP--glucose-1-phosphate uridylyltransferase